MSIERVENWKQNENVSFTSIVDQNNITYIGTKQNPKVNGLTRGIS